MIGGLGEHLVDRPLASRMHQQRVEFAQGHQYETALMESRMRDRESRLIDHTLAIE